MERINDYGSIHNLADLKLRKIELQLEAKMREQGIKDDVHAYIHQYSPGYLLNKYTRKPREKVSSFFGRVKSWFGGKKKA